MEEGYLQKWEQMNVAHKSHNYEARRMWDGNIPFTIVKYRVDGLKLDSIRGYYEDPVPI